MPGKVTRTLICIAKTPATCIDFNSVFARKTIGQVLTMPLFFASNAIYPISMMPSWLQVISRVNPLTYEVDILRSLMIVGGTSNYGVGVALLVLFAGMIVLVLIGSKLYPKVIV